MLSERVVLLLRYLDMKMVKYAELAIVGSYVARRRQSFAAEKNLQTKVEVEYVDLRLDINNTQKVTAELWEKIEVFQKGFKEELKRAEELTATLTKPDQLHAVELTLKALALGDCKAAKSLELERGKRLDADCSTLRSQLSMVEEQLSTVKAKLLET
ncbi:hypothetical protein AXG93_4311s1030 [Marchantia polymorpha subsp. ruderalis]|uniref:Uncharacterized protein n=1 Tax=Marchantia polymorpha subsp. ruderalis TaxID=1480154 RepID=A0A176W299_MARPO|nr:hypothetical protein AXG93_4311s1030 [Marchantia polymorpha subsp. ruderalis]